ncbi:uncharacterized protein At5g23160 [Solanum tuberosum]|uniref:Uncharacterized protein n=1 Tax=Solanum tuberosum TaxID=4113 RepID=M1D617_SOLTU|nr:PREDICTED: uncharacterized protein At5g23160 [Solanum tuberosum]
MEFDSPKKNKKLRKSYFLSCFGFSNTETELLSVNKSVKKKNKSKLLSFSKILRKNSSAAKTIPVDISDKFDNRSKEIHVVKSEKVKTPAIAGDVTQAPVVKSQNQTNIHEKYIKKTKDHKTKDIIHKNNKSLDKLLDKVRDNSTCRNEFSRSVTISSTHNSNQIIKIPTKDKHEIKFSHSKSLPPPKQKNPVTGKKVNDDEKSSQRRRERVLSHDNFDSIMGMSILMVTLLIMLFWGKACAIVCTCAWFYFLPRIRTKNEAVIAGKIDGVAGDVDLNSAEYKKKVVLEGFLERNHRSGVGFL